MIIISVFIYSVLLFFSGVWLYFILEDIYNDKMSKRWVNGYHTKAFKHFDTRFAKVSRDEYYSLINSKKWKNKDHLRSFYKTWKANVTQLLNVEYTIDCHIFRNPRRGWDNYRSKKSYAECNGSCAHNELVGYSLYKEDDDETVFIVDFIKK